MIEDYLEPLKDSYKVLHILHKISIFGGLTDNQLTEVFSHSFIAEVPIRTRLFSPGDSPKYIYILIEGSIKLFITHDNVEYEFFNFNIGDCFGEASLVSIEPHTASAICTSNCKLVLLSRRALMNIHKSNPDLFGRIILNIGRELGRRLHKTNNLLFEYVGHKHGDLIKRETAQWAV